MLISANHNFLEKPTRMYPTISPTSSSERKSPSHLPHQKRWLHKAIFKGPAGFATKTSNNSDEDNDNADTANSKNDKSVSKITVKQFDQQPSSIVKL